MGQITDRERLDTCDTLLREIHIRLQSLESELSLLRHEQAAREHELAAYKKKVAEQAKELGALRQQAQHPGHAPKVVASERRQKFHRLTCDYAKDILRSDHALVYEGREKAIAAGYKPCSSCCS